VETIILKLLSRIFLCAYQEQFKAAI